MSYYFIAGHGEGDPGATRMINGTLVKESDLTRELVSHICALTGCEHYPFEKDAFKHTKELPAAIPLDVTNIVEVHFNSFTSLEAHGTEVWTLATGYQRIPVHELSSKVADAIGTANRGCKVGGLKVISKLNATGFNACLLEVCFLSSTLDMDKYEVGKVATAVIHALNLPIIQKQPQEKAERWSDKYMEKVKTLGIMTDGRPTDTVTREELAAVICRTLELVGNG